MKVRSYVGLSCTALCLALVPHRAQAEAVWSGGGDDNRAATAKNWSAETVPDLTGGTETLKFATGGAEALFGSGVSLSGLVFDYPAAITAFTLGSELATPAALTVGTGGLSARNTAADGLAHVTTVDVPVVLGDPAGGRFEWTADANQEIHLTKGASDGGAYKVVVLQGQGTFRIDGFGDAFKKSLVSIRANTVRLKGAATADVSSGALVYLTQTDSTYDHVRWFDGGYFDGTYTYDSDYISANKLSMGFAENTESVFLKPFTMTASSGTASINFYRGAKAVFAGGATLTGRCPYVYFADSKASITVRNSPLDVNATAGMIFYAGYPGSLVLEVAGNSFNKFDLQRATTIDCRAERALDDSSRDNDIVFTPDGGKVNVPAIDLGGFDQYVGNVSGVATIRSGSPAVLHVNQHLADSALSDELTFTGGAGLEKRGAFTLTLAKANSSTGTLAVTEGTLVLKSSWAGTNVCVSGSARLELAGAAFPAEAVLRLDGSARIEFGADMQVAQIVLDGEPVENGKTCGAIGSGADIEDGRFEGPGVVLAYRDDGKPIEAVWTAGGGADTKTSTGSNWDIGTEPDFTLGRVIATFADAGGKASFDKDALLAGLKFALPAALTSFTLEADPGKPGATLTLGEEGLVIANAAAAGVVHTNRVVIPVVLGADLDLDVPANSVLELTGGLSDNSTVRTFNRTGAGVVRFAGENDSLSETTVRLEGTTVFQGRPFGVSDRNLVLQQSDADYSRVYRFEGATIGRPTYYAEPSSIKGNQTEMRFAANTTNSFERPFNWEFFSIGGGLTVEEGASVTFGGGASFEGSWAIFSLFENSSVVFSGAALQRTGQYSTNPLRLYAYGPSTVRLEAQGCRAHALQFVRNITVECGASYALTTNGCANEFVFASNTAAGEYPTLDLGGFDQAVGDLRAADELWSYPAGKGGLVTSVSPAVLHVHQDRYASGDVGVRFAGGAGLGKSGAETLTLAAVSSTTGTLSVAGGTLAFAGDGAWPNVSEVVLTGGELSLDTATRLRRRVDLRLDGGKLNIASGVEVRIGYAYGKKANGEWETLPVGLYTAASHPQYVSGAGAFRVTRGGGMVLLVR